MVLSKMLCEGTNRRIHSVDRHAGVVRTPRACLPPVHTTPGLTHTHCCLWGALQAIAGLLPDGRQLANRARAEASNYLSFYGDRIPAQLLADRLASFIHLYTLYWSVRPFGASLLLAVADAPTSGASQPSSASLFMLDPAGEAHRHFGTAVGKGRQQARTEIERLALSNLTCREAVVEVAKIIHKCHDEKDKTFELEMSWVCAESGWQHQRVPKDVAEEAQKQALAALEAMED